MLKKNIFHLVACCGDIFNRSVSVGTHQPGGGPQEAEQEASGQREQGSPQARGEEQAGQRLQQVHAARAAACTGDISGWGGGGWAAGAGWLGACVVLRSTQAPNPCMQRPLWGLLSLPAPGTSGPVGESSPQHAQSDAVDMTLCPGSWGSHLGILRCETDREAVNTTTRHQRYIRRIIRGQLVSVGIRSIQLSIHVVSTRGSILTCSSCLHLLLAAA